MFEIPEDPPSRNGSPFRDETYDGPVSRVANDLTRSIDQDNPWQVAKTAKGANMADQAEPPQQVQSPEETTRPKEAEETTRWGPVPEWTMKAPKEKARKEEKTTQFARAGERKQQKDYEAMMLERRSDDKRDRISYRNQVRRAKVESLKLARAGTSYEKREDANPKVARCQDFYRSTVPRIAP